MKNLVTLAAVLALCACSAVPEASTASSLTIRNPEAFGTQPPAVDDGGVPLAVPTAAAPQPFPWAHTGRVAD